MSNFRKNIWLYGILIAFGLFASIIISLAVIASDHPVDLVVDDYYKAEIAFQQQINKEKHLDSLGQKPGIEYIPVTNALMIKMPEKQAEDIITGYMHFYRPDCEKNDFSLSLQPIAGRQMVDASKMQKGRWKLKMDWSANGTDYYFEKNFDLK